MKIGIVGLGAVGGYLAARLESAGHEVSAVARGATLAAVREHGLRLQTAQGTSAHRIRASADATELGTQDLVIVALKSHQLEDALAAVDALSGARAPVLTAMNGVPWWFMQDQRGFDARTAQLESVDPHGRIAAGLPRERVLAAVVHLTCSVSEPGVVRHGFGDRLIVGAASGANGSLEPVVQALRAAALQIEPTDDIRQAIWFKLWGNMTMNPVSALTLAPADRILDDPLVHAFCLSVMREAAAVGERIGCPISQSGEARMAVTRQLGSFKTSMLQDVEAARVIELGALVGAVREIAQRLDMHTPFIDALLGLTRLMAAERDLLPR
jgi:2-dehydropantoate 2-reductase